jgi:hypothetical protein
MATKATRGRNKKKAPPKKTKAKAKPVKAKKRLPFLAVDEIATIKEELAEARAELARIANVEVSARRDLETQSSLGRSLEERLRAELEAVRVDLRTALADLEIARADHQRSETKLIDVVRELATAHLNERQAAHAAADARDRQLDLERENERLRAQLAARAEHDEEVTTPKLKEN